MSNYFAADTTVAMNLLPQMQCNAKSKRRHVPIADSIQTDRGTDARYLRGRKSRARAFVRRITTSLCTSFSGVSLLE